MTDFVSYIRCILQVQENFPIPSNQSGSSYQSTIEVTVTVFAPGGVCGNPACSASLCINVM